MELLKFIFKKPTQAIICVKLIKGIIEKQRNIESTGVCVWNPRRRRGVLEERKRTCQGENSSKADMSTRRKELRIPAIMRAGRRSAASGPEGKKAAR